MRKVAAKIHRCGAMSLLSCRSICLASTDEGRQHGPDLEPHEELPDGESNDSEIEGGCPVSGARLDTVKGLSSKLEAVEDEAGCDDRPRKVGQRKFELDKPAT